MNRPIFGIVLLVSVLATEVIANRALPRSIEEMHEQSLFVADGVVLESTVVNEEVIEVPNAPPVVLENFESRFLIQDVLKVDPLYTEKFRGGREVLLSYQRTNDSRFRGDNPSLLREGDRFRFYGHRPSSSDGEELVFQVLTANSIRPEAYEIEKRQATDSVEDEKVSQPRWWIIVILLLFIAGLLAVFFRRRK
ncbi:MAG: hypothetical protein AAGJ81_04195 [Verrucomicrobiota bacterium]